MMDAIQVVALRGGTTARELGEALGMPKSTVHRLVAGMVEVGLVRREDDGDRYVLGDLMAELAGGQSGSLSLLRACRPPMMALRDETGETIGLHVLNAERRVLLYQAESPQQHRWVYNNPLVPMPLHAGAAAKMLLALMPEATATRILRRDGMVAFTKRTLRSLE
ncbi:MAG: IclR family transcriptional regulator, partial [bacterium]